ncbi:hypothetical protein EYF80_029693 [Liparis tanakae]|uniref:Uncharacterized protein n=1 Tax=Liparis tanakae TaxID=230148 RepID=A0A4Z2H3E8_9TELE|nr:hypothetical protein EYF80_029693 [Liparis tanakae]
MQPVSNDHTAARSFLLRQWPTLLGRSHLHLGRHVTLRAAMSPEARLRPEWQSAIYSHPQPLFAL